VLVLGIDPGTAITGYGLVREDDEGSVLVGYGVITTPADQLLPQRLQTIPRSGRHYRSTGQIWWWPKTFSRNVRTAPASARRGVWCCWQLPSRSGCTEHKPLEVKQTVVGYGGADKRQVVRLLLTGAGPRTTPPMPWWRWCCHPFGG
jgi:crossover junction endodeoxyribonuclease RuvC